MSNGTAVVLNPRPGQSAAALYAVGISAAPPPTPGTINPGDLLVDAQYKTLWLGVDASIDPIQSILICDMAALLANDTLVLSDAKAYTDSQVALRAPLSHTHTHNQITDWDQAVIDTVTASVVNFKAGMILAYHGPLTDLASMTGWALCDGTQGTPDLRDKFILGGGREEIPSNTPVAGSEALVSEAGSHNHYNGMDSNWQVANSPGQTQYHTLTASQIPSHNHGYAEDIQGTGGNPDGHHHTIVDFGTPTNIAYQAGASIMSVWRKTSADLVVNPSPVYITVLANSTSATPQHMHVINWQAGHKHRIPIDFYKTGLPWFALAYIMKT